MMATYTWEEIRDRAKVFSHRWKGAAAEQAEAQLFLSELLGVFGVDLKRVATFEFKVPQGSRRNGYIDMLWKGRILIEMKSRGKDLDRAYIQAKDYAFSINDDEDLPEYIMVCDFERIRLYRQTTGQKWEFTVKHLADHVKKLSILTDQATKYDFIVNQQLNRSAAYLMADLHDSFYKYGYTGHSLEVYLVRILFCLFAEDSGLLRENQFYDYIKSSKEDGSDLAGKITLLFEVLNTPKEKRQTSLSHDLLAFEYVNGGLFEERLPSAAITREIRDILLKCCSFKWSDISPSIFGSMFQGVMDQKNRRKLGAHYTSEQNILKVLKPLFLDALWEDFERVKSSEVQLDHFHNKVASLKFLDPACGCGNFLVVIYRELRLLELEILKMKIDNTKQLEFEFSIKDQIKVNVNQFYGIEFEEFPGQIAQVAMWIMDHLMNNLVVEHFGIPIPELPLKDAAHIHYGHENGNALRIDWEDVVAKNELSFIVGNPPFKGFKYATSQQKEDMSIVFGEKFKTDKLDYVSAWYKKAVEYIQGTKIGIGYISTNSIVQGTQVGSLWGDLMSKYKIYINFAHQSFVWSNEAKGKAAVHCVIIGFACFEAEYKKLSKYTSTSPEPITTIVKHINPYLLDAPDIILNSRSKPICDVPEIIMGNQAMDGGNLIISEEEYEEFISREPLAKPYIKRYMMGQEFISNKKRYCLWLANCPPSELRKMPLVLDRVNNVKIMRSKSTDAGARRMAETPTLFREKRNPDNYIAIPITSSEKRKYIPMGYLNGDVIPGNTLFIIPNAKLYHFGILTSSVHLAWLKIVGARLKSDYRYSKEIVYNNFPWPTVNEDIILKISDFAGGILDARLKYPESSLADLYDRLTMPPELSKAHNRLDKLVLEIYGFDQDMSETEIVKELILKYRDITN